MSHIVLFEHCVFLVFLVGGGDSSGPREALLYRPPYPSSAGIVDT